MLIAWPMAGIGEHTSTDSTLDAGPRSRLVEPPSRTWYPACHHKGMDRRDNGRFEPSSSRPRERTGASTLTEASADAVAATGSSEQTESRAEDRIDETLANDLIKRFQEEYGRTNAQVKVERNMWLEELEHSRASQPTKER